MPCKRSEAEETRSTATGGATIGIHHVGADEVTHYGQENEEIIGTTCSPATDYCHPRKSNGSHTEAATSVG